MPPAYIHNISHSCQTDWHIPRVELPMDTLETMPTLEVPLAGGRQPGMRQTMSLGQSAPSRYPPHSWSATAGPVEET